MEYQDVKEWLDELIRMHEEIRQMEEFNSSIQTVNLANKGIQFFKGIETVADIMGLELIKSKWQCQGKKDTKYTFYYSGIEFLQIGSSDSVNKRLESIREGK